MKNLSLTACSFHFQKKNTKGQNNIHYLNSEHEYVKLDIKHKISTKEALFNFFNAHKTSDDDEKNKRLFECDFEDSHYSENDKFAHMYAIIKTGEYGYTSEIFDNSSKKVVHKKTEQQAEMMSLYIYVVIPKDNDDVNVQKGLLFFQNIGSFGIKTVTTDYMKKFFSCTYDLTLKCRNISPELFVDKMMTQQNIQKLRMIKNKKSVIDKSDNLNIGYGVEERTISNLSFTAVQWDNFMNKMKHYSRGKFYFFEFEDYEYDTLKVVADIGGRPRTIDTHNLEHFSIIEGIPDEVKMANGLPDKGKLLGYFEKVAEEYLSHMALKIQ